MTEVATSTGTAFLKLLFRWRCSMYKLMWKELIFYLLVYYSLNLTYRWFMNAEQKLIFEQISSYCHVYSSNIPLAFVLGFYVKMISGRWWEQLVATPFTETFALVLSANLNGEDERGRLMRRAVMRYVCLSITLLFSKISMRVKKRFPTRKHYVQAGLLTEMEDAIMEEYTKTDPKYSLRLLPMIWATNIISQAEKEGRVTNQRAIIDGLNKIRSKITLLEVHDSVGVPLVYTQAVTLVIYLYFVTNVMGFQWLETDPKNAIHNYVDKYFPVYATLLFFLYMGWLKVAESMIHPFGEDDEDFDLNLVIDENLKSAYRIVDVLYAEYPELAQDRFWNPKAPDQLPYCEEKMRESQSLPSTAAIV